MIKIRVGYNTNECKQRQVVPKGNKSNAQKKYRLVVPKKINRCAAACAKSGKYAAARTPPGAVFPT